MRKKSCSRGLVVIAFGVGLFLAYCFPGKFVLVALAVMLVVAGIFLLKN